MSQSDCILEEVNPSTNNKMSAPEIVVEICTPDFHIDNCDCIIKQEQIIKELQAKLDRQRKQQQDKQKEKEKEAELKQKEKEKKIKDIQSKINEYAKLVDEQRLFANQKYKEASEANQKYYQYYSEYNKYKLEYKNLTMKHNYVNVPIIDFLNVIYSPSYCNF